MTSAERRSSSNLILLCGDHHDAIDSQLSFHTTDWLRKTKKSHEDAMDRAAEYAMGTVGYKELQMVCDGLVMGVDVADGEIDEIEEAIEIYEKVEINDLGPLTRSFIELGMAQDREVRKFLSMMDQIVLGFSNRLTSRFRAVYYSGVAEGVSGDDLFSNIVGTTYAQCGPRLTPEVQAASLAVVVHLFSICEIFEHEPSTSQ
ncbi:ABC-three component system protein [Williamsia soli]|uniref:ABC-three component system protein n=1 Tax=Williamsia soli TaxID=364929 RepID=UPI001A9D3E83|nr:ABC-three component system protein [Williamsia soli]